MSATLKKAVVKFIGTKPLLFDRYGGTNDSKLELIDKVYWSKDGFAVMPQINIYSALSAENTKSVAKMFFGKRAKAIGLSINNSLNIVEPYPFIFKDGERIHRDDFEKHFTKATHVARINKSGTAIPNPKERPCLDTPWEIQFNLEFVSTLELTWEVMKQCFEYCGMIGLGTYRPLYGGFKTEIAAG